VTGHRCSYMDCPNDPVWVRDNIITPGIDVYVCHQHREFELGIQMQKHRVGDYSLLRVRPPENHEGVIAFLATKGKGLADA